MVEQSEAALLRRRRGFLAGRSLLSVLLAAGGILIGLLDGIRFGYVIAALFGFCAVVGAVRLLTPSEFLLQLPASDFAWIAPSEATIPPDRSRASAGKPAPPVGRVSPSRSGVWDRELDGAP